MTQISKNHICFFLSGKNTLIKEVKSPIDTQNDEIGKPGFPHFK